MAYAEDDAGGLMNPRYARVRPDASADEAIRYLQRQAREVLETIYYVYVIDADQKILGVVSFRDLFAAPADKPVRELMATDLVTAREDMDQEELGRLFAQHDLQAIPVVDAHGRMKGIVTVDDIVDVIREEATEDIQKIGGTQALDAPYLEVSLPKMVGKRVGWLAGLFVSEMLTTTAMSRFETEIERAVVLAIFIPLIISSGGNSGSQASTLVIRAMALGEVRLVDWWRVIKRELASGLAMGAILGDRVPQSRAVAAALPCLRAASFPRRSDHRRQRHRRGDLGDARRLDAAIHPQARRAGSGERLRSLRGHAGGRDGNRHLLLGRRVDPARHAAVGAPHGLFLSNRRHHHRAARAPRSGGDLRLISTAIRW